MNYHTKDKPYNTLTEYNKQVYHAKLAKVSLNLNFTCPNKDGTKGYGGCTYCSKLGSGDFAGNRFEPLDVQYYKIKEIMDKKWPNLKYVPYLQANTNTYAPLFKLKELYKPLLTLDPLNTPFISISTRADALDLEKIKYLGELNKIKPIEIELGLQTSNEKTANLINRCETNKEFEYAINLLIKENIKVVVHIMNGLPNEDEVDMLNTIKYLNQFDIKGIKIHSLLILKDTKMGIDYLNNPFKLLTLDEYTDIVVKQICIMNPNFIIERLAADGRIDDLIEPKWTIKKMVVMNEIDKKLRRNNLYQGIYYNKEFPDNFKIN